MRLRLIAFGLTIMILFNFSACDLPFFQKEEKEPDITETDPNFPVEVLGVTIKEKPQNIVVLSAGLLEKLYDLQLQYDIVGVPDFTDYPADATQLDPCGTALLPNLEMIEDLSADLVLTQSELTEDVIGWMENEGIPVVTLPTATTPEELWSIYENLALALEGKEMGAETGSTFTANLAQYWSELQASTQGEEPKAVLYIRQMDFTIATGDTLEGTLLKGVGFTNMGDGYTNWMLPKEEAESDEGKAALKAVEMLFFSEEEITMDDLEKNATYKGIPAVKEDRYHLMNYQPFERQSLRMFTELEGMITACYPDVSFPTLDLSRKVEVARDEDADVVDSEDNGVDSSSDGEEVVVVDGEDLLIVDPE